jgi:hypothetical protein
MSRMMDNPAATVSFMELSVSQCGDCCVIIEVILIIDIDCELGSGGRQTMSLP